jgi:electron transport complex protein RnfD
MWTVVIALLPTLLVSFRYFGIDAVRVTLVSVLTCVIVEWFLQRFVLKGKQSIGDGSAVITGLLLAFNLPSHISCGIVVLGAVVAIGISKMAFGGLGKNPFNPALVGRVFLLISFPTQMTSWTKPLERIGNFFSFDATTSATPLGQVRAALGRGENVTEMLNQLPDYAGLLIGDRAGSLGEAAIIAILLGGLFMLFRKVISWHIPVAFIGTAFVFAALLHGIDPARYIPPSYHLLFGGLMLGAVFMATDMVTSPMSKRGQIVFGIGCGLLTILIRVWGNYPEGVSFAILIMNAFVPLINKGFKPRRFGLKAVKN